MHPFLLTHWSLAPKKEKEQTEGAKWPLAWSRWALLMLLNTWGNSGAKGFAFLQHTSINKRVSISLLAKRKALVWSVLSKTTAQAFQKLFPCPSQTFPSLQINYSTQAEGLQRRPARNGCVRGRKVPNKIMDSPLIDTVLLGAQSITENIRGVGTGGGLRCCCKLPFPLM